MKIPFLVGRLVFGGFFLYNGINHFKQRKELAKHASSKHVPMPEAAVTVSGGKDLDAFDYASAGVGTARRLHSGKFFSLPALLLRSV